MYEIRVIILKHSTFYIICMYIKLQSTIYKSNILLIISDLCCAIFMYKYVWCTLYTVHTCVYPSDTSLKKIY